MSDIQEYKCPCCGGAIEFNSTVQKMKCPYCDTEFEMEALKSYDDALGNDRPDEMSWENKAGGRWKDNETEGMSVYVCKSCGGEIVGDRNTAAASCPFCGNPVVMTGQLSGDLRPNYVIPFKLDKKAAKASLKKHLSGKRLLPKLFKEEKHIDEIKGIYVPFWLFDAEAEADIRYRGTKIRSWSDSEYNYTETSHYMILRRGKIAFENIPVDGSEKISNELMESIEPFDFSQAVDFQNAYLAGYLADKYDVTDEACIPRADERVKQSTEKAFENTVRGYLHVAAENSSIRLNNGQVKYALYPVWFLNTTWKGGSYIFAMNGQTGKFVGDLPEDKGAKRKWFWGITGVCSAVVYGLLWLINLI